MHLVKVDAMRLEKEVSFDAKQEGKDEEMLGRVLWGGIGVCLTEILGQAASYRRMME